MRYSKITVLLIAFLVFAGCTTDDPGQGGNGVDKSANLKTLGTSATDLLSSEKFTSMRIELVYVNGHEPTQKTIDNLKRFLQERTHKPDGYTIFKRAVASSGKAPFSIQEIADIESEERTAFNAGDEIAVYIYFADGSNENDTSTKIVLGSAFRNTSIVIYGETVNNISSRLNAPDKSTVESTVLNHEFGHLFGLVNLGTPLQTDHEDSSSSGHCEVDGCLMNANVQFGRDLIDMVDNNTTPQMDDKCILDLQANGGR
ncbi:hypothetical protein DHB64_07370 [Antarcticibacterium sp. W02-3]|uniref:hypothetical protein n=1 Tax=Antarcticibacterium sp. W02-3 TaxID=2183747 RepID=UPI00204468FC|nr:hypothetical protein [Antarcticibacterium sp. W02-3]MCM4159711.1 hypothetical protein [Antarcticibacterium sp. W02-3]